MLIVKENISLRQNPICKVSTGFSLRPVARNKGKRGRKWGQTGCTVVGLLGVCVFADHCKTNALWRRQSDCHSAGFSSLNKVGVSNRTSIDQKILPRLRQVSEAEVLFSQFYNFTSLFLYTSQHLFCFLVLFSISSGSELPLLRSQHHVENIIMGRRFMIIFINTLLTLITYTHLYTVFVNPRFDYHLLNISTNFIKKATCL